MIDLVGRNEIATRLNVALVTVDKWRERHADFPTPQVVSGAPVWEWPAVEEWAASTGRLRCPEHGARGTVWDELHPGMLWCSGGHTFRMAGDDGDEH